MKLKNNLFEILSEQQLENGISYELKLNAEHIIYKAHFPSQPITPGVCVLQMAIELLSQYLRKEIELIKVNNLKFISILAPDVTPCVIYDIQNIKEDSDLHQIKAQILVRYAEVTYAKISITCRIK